MIRIATTKVVLRMEQSWQRLAHQFNPDLEKKTKSVPFLVVEQSK